LTTETTSSSAAADQQDNPGPGTSLLGDSGRIAVAAALSRLTGLLRIVVAASVLGATVLGDLFVAINVLPLTLYDVFAGSAISAVLVPPMVRLLDRSHRDAQRFAANALGVICVAMAVVAVAAVAGRGVIAAALTAGVEPGLQPDALRVAGLLLAFIIPQLVLYAAIGVFVSIQHAKQRFLLPSAAPIVENVGLLITIGVAWSRFGTGIEVDQATTDLIVTLAVGSGLSVSAHAVVQFVGARRALGRIGFGADWRDREIVALAEPAKSSFGWSSTIAVRQFALVVAAGFAGAGGVQAFEIATLAYFVPVALIGRPIASAALPRLARTVNAGPDGRSGSAPNRSDDLLAGYRAALRLTAWVAVPAGVALVLLSSPLADVIAQGRFSDGHAVTMLRYGLAGLGLGAMSEALFEVTRQTTMATGDGRALTRSTWIRTGAAVVGLPMVVLALDGPAVILGLGLVVTVGDLAALTVAHRTLVATNARPVEEPAYGHGLRIFAASVLGIAPLTVAGSALGITWSPLTAPLLIAAAVVTVGVSCWLLTGRGRLLKSLVEELRTGSLS
jgi:putative peptidoglycan lipid II flippase